MLNVFGEENAKHKHSEHTKHKKGRLCHWMSLWWMFFQNKSQYPNFIIILLIAIIIVHPSHDHHHLFHCNLLQSTTEKQHGLQSKGSDWEVQWSSHRGAPSKISMMMMVVMMMTTVVMMVMIKHLSFQARWLELSRMTSCVPRCSVRSFSFVEKTSSEANWGRNWWVSSSK